MEYTFDEEIEEFEYDINFIREQSKYFSFFHYKGEDYFVNDIFLH